MNDYDLAERVLERLTDRGLTLAVAESLTGGLVLATLTSVPGASVVVLGGVVSYSTSVKENVLGVAGDLLRERGPANSPVAEEMSERVASLCGADIGLATTGVAGPGDHYGVSAGVYWVAVSWRGQTQARQHRVDGNRDSVRAAAVRSVLDLVLSVVDRDHEGLGP